MKNLIFILLALITIALVSSCSSKPMDLQPIQKAYTIPVDSSITQPKEGLYQSNSSYRMSYRAYLTAQVLASCKPLSLTPEARTKAIKESIAIADETIVELNQ